MHFPRAIARIFRRHQRHMAIGAVGRMIRVIERPRALPGNTAGLPIVVVVKTSKPAVPVYRHVQVHFVACRAEFRGILPHERLHKRPAVRFRIEISQEIIDGVDVLILAAYQLVERWVSNGKGAIAHGAVHVHDRMARGARQSGVGFRRVDLLLDRPVETPVEEDSVIVATRAPLARARPHHALHVLHGFPVELVVKGCEVVRRTLPLLKNILVTFAAGFRIHEEVRGNDAAHVRLCRGRKERRLRAAAFSCHGGRGG